jgi:hypothetical protein
LPQLHLLIRSTLTIKVLFQRRNFDCSLLDRKKCKKLRRRWIVQSLLQALYWYVRKERRNGATYTERFLFCFVYNLESKSEYNETNADNGKKFVIDTSILQLKAKGSVVTYIINLGNMKIAFTYWSKLLVKWK